MKKPVHKHRIIRAECNNTPTDQYVAEIWNRELISILRKRESQNFDVTLTNHLNGLLNFEVRGNRNLIYHEILARVIASLDEDQKKKFHKRLNFFISSLDKIIKNQSKDFNAIG